MPESFIKRRLDAPPTAPAAPTAGGSFIRRRIEAPDLDTLAADAAPPDPHRDRVSAAGVAEPTFQAWYGQRAKTLGLDPNPDAPEQSYDYRAAFAAGAEPGPDGHWPSAFKKPGHPTMVVGGFHVQTGARVPGTPRASRDDLVRLGWEPDAAARLDATQEPIAAKSMGDIMGQATGISRAPEPRGALGTLVDFGMSLPRRLGVDPVISAVKGAIGAVNVPVGLADIATGGRVGQFLEETVGFRPAEATKILSSWYSKKQREGSAAVQAADGVLATAVAALSNPGVVANTVVESAPMMLAGGAIGRAIPYASAGVRGALGEGIASAGSAASHTREGSEDGRLTVKQSALAVATGAATTTFGLLGNRIAQSLGIADIDTMIAAGAASPVAARGLATRVALGMVQEGVLEELPQSISEQLLANVAQDRPILEGVDESAVLGLFSGAVMGGGANIRRPRTAAGAPSAPPMADLASEAPPAAPSPAPVDAPPVAPRGTPPAYVPTDLETRNVRRLMAEPGRTTISINDVSSATAMRPREAGAAIDQLEREGLVTPTSQAGTYTLTQPAPAAEAPPATMRDALGPLPPGVSAEQTQQLTALGYAPERVAAMTLPEVQEALRTGTPAVERRQQPRGLVAPAIADPMSPEGLVALGTEFMENPARRADVASMRTATRAEAPPREATTPEVLDAAPDRPNNVVIPQGHVETRKVFDALDSATMRAERHLLAGKITEGQFNRFELEQAAIESEIGEDPTVSVDALNDYMERLSSAFGGAVSLTGPLTEEQRRARITAKVAKRRELRAAEPQEPFQDEAGRAEWAANADRVASNPEEATDRDLQKAVAFLTNRRDSKLRRARDGGPPVSAELLASINTEIEHYDRLVNARRAAPAAATTSKAPSETTTDLLAVLQEEQDAMRSGASTATLKEIRRRIKRITVVRDASDEASGVAAPKPAAAKPAVQASGEAWRSVPPPVRAGVERAIGDVNDVLDLVEAQRGPVNARATFAEQGEKLTAATKRLADFRKRAEAKGRDVSAILGPVEQRLAAAEQSFTNEDAADRKKAEGRTRIAEFTAKYKAEGAALAERFARDGYLYATDPKSPNRALFLAPSTRAGVKYQVTSFHSGEPTGHRDYDNLGNEGKVGPLDSAVSEFRGMTLQERPRSIDARPEKTETEAHDADGRREGAETGPVGDVHRGSRTGVVARAHEDRAAKNRKRRVAAAKRPAVAAANAVDALYADVLADAQALDPLVDPADVRAEWDFRAGMLLELGAEAAAADPRVLLKRIAKSGGIYQKSEINKGKQAEEVTRLSEGQRFGNVLGIGGVFASQERKMRPVARKVDGQAKIVMEMRGGLPLDVLLQDLQAEGDFPFLNAEGADVNTLTDWLDDVQKSAATPRATIMEKLEITRGTAWWENRWVPEADAFASDAVDTGEGDDSFDFAEIDEPVSRPFTAATLQEAMGLPEEQAAATYALAEAMGLDLDQVEVVKGGSPGSGALEQQKTRLSVLHNLSAENLAFVGQMGGIPVPSLGITKQTGAMRGFGEITLIGRAHLADPTAEPVFDADAYSGRSARPLYPPVKMAVAKPFYDALRPYAVAFDDAHDETWDNLVREAKPKDIIRRMARGPASAAWFLDAVHGTTVQPVREVDPAKLMWSAMVDAATFTDAYQQMRGDGTEDAGTKAMQAVLSSAVDLFLDSPKGRAYAAAITERGSRRTARAQIASAWGQGPEWLTDVDALGFGMVDTVRDDIRRRGQTRVNTQKTNARVARALKGKEAEFATWVDEKVWQMFGPPYLTVNGKKAPYTLANIVDAATSTRIRGVEETPTYGTGKTRAAASRRFTSLEQMRSSAERSVLDEEAIEAGRLASIEALEAYRDSVIGAHDEGTWEALDASMRAIARYAGGAKTDANMRNALRREGFKVSKVDNAGIVSGMEAARLLLAAPVPYFEVKPQRAVMLNEFAGAVIPKDASPGTRSILDTAGLPYVEYSNKGGLNEAKRGAAVVKFRRQLSRQGQNVLFQKAGKTTWYYDNVQEALKAWQAKGTVDQLLAHLKKTKGAMDEVADIGLDTWLKGHTSVTREAVQRYVTEHAVTIEEVTLQDDASRLVAQNAAVKELTDAGYEVKGDDDDYYLYAPNGTQVEVASDGAPDVPDNIAALWATVASSDNGRPDYDNYQLEGPRSDYREILLKWTPPAPPVIQSVNVIDEGRWQIALDGDADHEFDAYIDQWEFSLPGRKGQPFAGTNDRSGFQAHVSDRGGTKTFTSFDDAVAWAKDRQLARASASIERRQDRRTFTAPHFGVEGKNLLLHLRVNVRTLADGRRVLFLEEVQSDLHQKGRQKGYKQRLSPAQQARLVQLDAISVERDFTDVEQAEYEPLRQSTSRDTVPDAPFKDAGWKKLALKRTLAMAAEQGMDGIAWTTGTQQVARYEESMRNVVDRISWVESETTSDYNAERVKIADGTTVDEDQFIARVQSDAVRRGAVPSMAYGIAGRAWQRIVRPDDRNMTLEDHLVELRTKGPKEGHGHIADAIEALRPVRVEAKGDPVTVVRGAKNGTVVFSGSIRDGMFVTGPAKGKDVASVLGKEVADKISKDVAGDLKGDGLTIGGEGMKGFYDKELVNLANDLAKRYGQRVEKGQIDVSGFTSKERYAGPELSIPDIEKLLKKASRDGSPVVVTDQLRAAKTSIWAGTSTSFAEAMEKFGSQTTATYVGGTMTSQREDAPIHVLATPPEMREAITKYRLPLFQQVRHGSQRQSDATGAQASVEFAESGKAIIRGLENPNASSGVHELAHIARRWLFNRDIPAENRRGITDEDIATAEDWAGAKDGTWGEPAEEKFARGFERYLRDGATPTTPKTMRGIFAKFAAWLGDVYESLGGSPIDVDISPAMRGVFDRLVTRRERNAAEDTKSVHSRPVRDPDMPIGGYKTTAPRAAKAKTGAVGDLSAARAARREKTLDTIFRNDGRSITVRDYVNESVSQGGRVVTAKNGERRLMKPDGAYLNERDLTAAGMNYASGMITDAEIGATKADVLDTGEVQNRLPGDVGAVRDEERAQPTEEVPFSLTNEIGTRSSVQGTLGGLTSALDQIEQAAKDRITKRGTFSGKRLSAGLPIDDLADFAVIGAAKVARGAATLARFTAEMVREFGEAIREHIPAIFADAKNRAALVSDLDIDDYFNLKRVNISDEERAELRGSITETIIRTDRIPKERESWDAIRAEARQLHPDAVRHLAGFQQAQAPFRAVRDAARRRINVLNQEIVEGWKAMNGSADPEDLLVREAVLAAKERDVQGLLDTWMRMRSEDGRNLAMHRMMADSMETWYDATFWMSKAKRQLELPPGVDLPIDVARALRDILGRGREAVETGMDATPIQLELSTFLTKLRRSTLLETIAALRKAGLLTGPKTHARNILGNAAFQILEETMRLPAVLVDMAVAVGTGHRTVHGISARAVAAASKHAATRGLQQAADVLRTGQTSNEMRKTDAVRELNSGIRWIDSYVNFVGRTMAATDRVFKSYAFRRSLEEQAALEAINTGVSPIELLARPSETMLARAVADAEFATFNNKNMVAEAVSHMKGSLRRHGDAGAVAAFTIEMAVPFVNTPSNIVARMLDYTPVGLAGKAGKAAASALVNKGMTVEQQRVFSLAIGRGLTGSALIYLGWTLAAAGLATGTGGDDEGDRNVRTAAGMLNGAVRIGNRWHQIATFSPAGNLVSLGAEMQRTSSRPFTDESKRAGKMIGIGAGLVLDQPMLKGMNDLIEALQRPESAGENFAASLAGSFVPTLVNDAASAFDPYRRNARPDGVRTSLWVGAQSRLPGLRNSLPPRLNVFGDRETQETRAIWDPTIATVARDMSDGVLRELIAHDVGVGWPQKRRGEAAEDYAKRVRVTGEAIRTQVTRVVASQAYRRATDGKQTEMLDDAIASARTRVRPKFRPRPRARFQEAGQ